MSTMSPEFERAITQVVTDLDLGNEADLVAAGVRRDDCMEFLRSMLDGEEVTAAWLAVLVQWSVAAGVWLERNRWQPAP